MTNFKNQFDKNTSMGFDKNTSMGFDKNTSMGRADGEEPISEESIILPENSESAPEPLDS
ncbi:hypothetical protein [Pedobacter mucosus]|uniref:hypothetical protein n=1 Tax=Pedobacter mucosus TaxID=2895286 RepID=UPI001EE44B30|nr:hypothetical protein [Pedobacter mucosus]UKT65749.1 hypothetical protein LOK61_08135 [Pedobacter mucosus]